MLTTPLHVSIIIAQTYTYLQQQQGTEIVTGTLNYPHVVSYSKLLVWMQKNVNFVTMTAENFFKIRWKYSKVWDNI